MSFDVYTVGGLEILSQVYKGIVMILGDSGMQTFLRVFMVWGLFLAISWAILKVDLKMFFQYMFITFFTFHAFFSVKADVNIIDTQNQSCGGSSNYVVSNVPLGVAAISSLASTASHYITGLTEQVFHTGTVNVWNATGGSNNILLQNYRDTGYGGYFETLDTLNMIGFDKVADKEINSFYNLYQSYWDQCIVLNFIAGDEEYARAVYTSDKIIDAVAPLVNGFASWGGQVVMCSDMYYGASGYNFGLGNGIGLQSGYEKVKDKFSNACGGSLTDGLLAQLGIKPPQAMKFTQSVADILREGAIEMGDLIGQAGMIAATRAAINRSLAEANPDKQAIVNEYLAGRNREEARQMGKALGLYALKIVPFLKMALESLFISLVPTIFLLMFIPGGAGLRLIRGFMVSIGWVYLVDPVLATLNGLTNTAFIAKAQTALAATGATGLNAYNYRAIMDAMDFFPAVAGYLGISAPAIAYGLLKGFEMTASNIVGMMAAPVMSTPPPKEAAEAAETTRMAAQTGKSFGAIEYSMNAAGQARLSQLAWQMMADKQGYGKVLGVESGALDYGLAQKLGLGNVVNKLGESGVAGMTYKQTIMNAATTEGQWEGIGGNPEILQKAAGIEQKYRTDYQARAIAQEMDTLTPEQFANFRVSQLGQGIGTLEGMIQKGRAMGLQGSDYDVARQMSGFINRGGVLDSSMAKSINETLFGGKDIAKSGMKADFGVSSDGKTYFTAVSQDKTKSVEIKNGQLIEKGVIDNKNELDALKKEASEAGFKNWAKYAKTGMGYEKTTSIETGQIVDLKAEREAGVLVSDKFLDDKSKTTTTVTKNDSGTIKTTYNVNRKEGVFHVVNPYTGNLETVSGTIDMTQDGKVVKMVYGQGEKGQFINKDGSVTEGYFINVGNKKYMVSGLKDSIVVEKGMIRDSEGFMHAGTVLKDGKTGMQLFIEGKSGKMYTTTLGGESWAFHRQLDMKGQAISSTITEHFGLGAGVTVEQMRGHFGEATGSFLSGANSLRAARGMSQGNKATKPAPEPKPKLYGPDGKPLN